MCQYNPCHKELPTDVVCRCYLPGIPKTSVSSSNGGTSKPPVVLYFLCSPLLPWPGFTKLYVQDHEGMRNGLQREPRTYRVRFPTPSLDLGSVIQIEWRLRWIWMELLLRVRLCGGQDVIKLRLPKGRTLSRRSCMHYRTSMHLCLCKS